MRTADVYPHYPTVRHRKRFVINSLRKLELLKNDCFLFDYGCGEGGILREVERVLGVNASSLGGCDLSAKAIACAREKVGSPHLYHGGFPEFDRKCNVVICCEVIEHVKAYANILQWIHNKLVEGGTLVLTTQTGRIHASDRYAGHVQHFTLSTLQSELTTIGFKIRHARLWGAPLFTLQKYLTNVNFRVVRDHCLEGKACFWRRSLFAATYWAYFVHDLVPLGPQIYVIATREQTA